MELGRWLRLAWDRAAAVALIVAGAVALVLGWVGVSGEAFPAKQLPYLISGGIAGVFILGLGALCWLSADLRDEWTKLDRIEDALNRLADTGLVDLQAREQQQAQQPSKDLVEA
ncbi:MAG TPA: hypothetical protein VJ622_03915 [Acidimicrobiia bacterium]|nr:hypothetical protein [Acidimicrobiia bacterium]